MLERLSIKNFALIEELSIDFCGSLNILTGETGAGKSIVIDAVGLLLGGRAQAEFIRSGADKSYLEATFILDPEHQVFEALAELGVEAEDGMLVMSREISVNGRNTCRINGRTLTLSQYKQIGLSIVDIHGQHDHQALLQAENHLLILDKCGGADQANRLLEIRKLYETWQACRRELDSLNKLEQERLQRLDILQYQIKDIEEANILPGEMSELAKEANILANAEKIVTNLNTAYGCLYSQERGFAAYDQLGKALAALNEICRYDSSLEKVIAELDTALYTLEESSSAIRNYLDAIEYSPERLEQVEKRWQNLKDLCRKYGPEEEDILAFAQKARLELVKWEERAERAGELEKQLQTLEMKYKDLARAISMSRQEIARQLEKKVTDELINLAMPHVRFKVSFSETQPTSKGTDGVEFLISPNPGEPLLPVARIASGGELSRIMLALKTIIASIDGIGTLIFDEIDSGLGGKAAQKLGEKLEEISQYQQVICVTHSPLVTAKADCHMLLEKEIDRGRTRTIVKILNQEERVAELVRMMGGSSQTEDLKRHACQILKMN